MILSWRQYYVMLASTQATAPQKPFKNAIRGGHCRGVQVPKFGGDSPPEFAGVSHGFTNFALYASFEV